MTPDVFFRTPVAKRVLRRASRCTGSPITLHWLSDVGEHEAVAGVGQCAVCRAVTATIEGRRCCHSARHAAGIRALRRNTPAPFVCPMGLACAVVRVLPELAYVLTVGPYCPIEARSVLEHDVRKGFEALGIDIKAGFPATLDDIASASTEAVPEIASWAAETLYELWQDARDASSAPMSDDDRPARTTPPRKKGRTPERDPYQAADIVAALAGGNQSRARTLVRAALSETRDLNVARARAVAIAAAALEAAARAEVDGGDCWARFRGLVQETGQARNLRELSAAVMGVLGVIKRRATRADEGEQEWVALNGIIAGRMAERLTLGEVAAELGRPPSTLTRRLQRKFGMSFTQYVGRLRVDKAKELLRRTKLTVGAVAGRVGISDQSNFSALFRKFEGMSPQEYRKRFAGRR